MDVCVCVVCVLVCGCVSLAINEFPYVREDGGRKSDLFIIFLQPQVRGRAINIGPWGLPTAISPKSCSPALNILNNDSFYTK